MTSLFTRKILSIVATAFVSVASFAFLGGVVSAAHEPLAKILESDLMVPVGTFDGIQEIDDVLYTNNEPPVLDSAGIPADFPVNISQIITLIGNIEKDGALVAAIQKFRTADQSFSSAQSACQYYTGATDCTGILGSGSVQSEDAIAAYDTALSNREAALNKLAPAAFAARDRQQTMIESYISKNNAEAIAVSTGISIYSTGTAATTNLSNQAGDDVTQGQAYTAGTAAGTLPSADQLAAMQQQRKDIVDQLSDDTLANRMQAACVFNPLSASPMNLTPCFANAIYVLVYKPTMYLLMGSGYIFDKMLDLSIDSKFVNQPFIDSAWGTIRDFSNMLFIFILLYTGIMTIFGAADWRKVVLQVVFIALIINFSLFFTKVVIDAGNILAVGVRSAIASGASISEGLAAGFQPQKFVSIAASSKDVNGGDAIVVFLISALVTGFAAYIFFKAALLFVRRLVVFWALMILSPFAFISTALPGKSNKFGEWLHTLISQTFVVPVFLFFIYIIMKAISANGGILNYAGFAQADSGWFASLIAPAIIAMLIIKALQEALSFAENMAGKSGEAVSGLVSGAIGLAAGAATGGASTLVGMAGRKFVGGAAADAIRGGNLKEGGMAEKAAQWATRASFDVRNAPVPKFASNAVGGAVKSLGLNVNVGKGAGVGGVEKAEQERIKEELKAVESQKVNIFQEQGMRNKAQEDERAAIEKGNIETSKISFQAKETTKAVEQAQKEVDAAQKTVNDSPTAGAVTSAKANYEEAVRNRMRGGTQEAVDAAKDVLERAETSHAGVTSSAGLQTTLSKLEAAKKAEKDALAALEKVKEEATDETKIAEKVSAAAKKATEEAVKEIEKVRRNKYVAGLEDKGRYTTADKVRKEAAKKKPVDEMKELLKKMAKEDADAEKAKEEKPAEEKKAEETK